MSTQFGSYVHDDVIKWKHFPRNRAFVRWTHRLPVNSRHKGQWRGALMCPLICAWINRWVNNREAGDLRHRRAHYDVTIMDQQKKPMCIVYGIHCTVHPTSKLRTTCLNCLICNGLAPLASACVFSFVSVCFFLSPVRSCDCNVND